MFSIFKKKAPMSTIKNKDGWPYYEEDAAELSISDIQDLRVQHIKENESNNKLANEMLKKKLVIAEYLSSWIENEIIEESKLDEIKIESGIYYTGTGSYVTITIKSFGSESRKISIYNRKTENCKIELETLFRIVDEINRRELPESTKKTPPKKKVVAKKKAAPKKKTPTKK